MPVAAFAGANVPIPLRGEYVILRIRKRLKCRLEPRLKRIHVMDRPDRAIGDLLFEDRAQDDSRAPPSSRR